MGGNACFCRASRHDILQLFAIYITLGRSAHSPSPHNRDMTRIEKLTVTMNGLLPVMTELVAKWSPPKLRSEIAYRDHLLAYVREAVPGDTKLEKEYRHRGTTMDLWLGWKGLLTTDELAFELKVNLKKKTDYDRLVGQIEGLQPKSNKVLVVLIGETDPALLGRLKEHYAALLKPPTGTATFLAIVLVEMQAA